MSFPWINSSIVPGKIIRAFAHFIGAVVVVGAALGALVVWGVVRDVAAHAVVVCSAVGFGGALSGGGPVLGGGIMRDSGFEELRGVAQVKPVVVRGRVEAPCRLSPLSAGRAGSEEIFSVSETE